MKKIIAVVVLTLSALAFAQYPSQSQCPNGAHYVQPPCYWDVNGNQYCPPGYWVCN